MRMQRAILLGLVIFSGGCSSFGLRKEPPIPSILRGSNQEIRQNLLQKIPVGSSRADAERIIRSLGLEPQPESDLNTGQPLILCNYTGNTGLHKQTTWLIQIDCPDGKVTDIVCEQIGAD